MLRAEKNEDHAEESKEQEEGEKEAGVDDEDGFEGKKWTKCSQKALLLQQTCLICEMVGVLSRRQGSGRASPQR